MLTTHRNQENLVPMHQGNVKQQPKTPGARFPKTPSKFGHNDENATTIFPGKSLLKDVKTTRQALVTPSETRARAPLGNKTTNAKARTDQALGGKDTVKQIGKSQIKPTTTHKPIQKQIAPLKLAVKLDENNASDDEPEFAPPNPKPLPYESDVLPKGGLTVRGLQKGSLLKGYYEHFHNPVDENGVSRRDKQFAEEMKKVVEEADKKNQQELDALDWGFREENKVSKPAAKKTTLSQPTKTASKLATVRTLQRNPPTIASRRAASALAMPTDREKSIAARSASSAAPARKPLSSLIRTSKTKAESSLNNSGSTGAAGNAASRTTLGYNKGRTASSIVHPTKPRDAPGPSQTRRAVNPADDWSELTITPARLQRGTPVAQPAHDDRGVPSFVSMFDHESDDEDLPGIKIPQELLADDEEEFEFK